MFADLAAISICALLARVASFDAWAVVVAVLYLRYGADVLPYCLIATAAMTALFRLARGAFMGGGYDNEHR